MDMMSFFVGLGVGIFLMLLISQWAINRVANKAAESQEAKDYKAVLHLEERHERDRAAWTLERTGLLDRIQAWNPTPPEAPATKEPASHPLEKADEQQNEDLALADELARDKIRKNSGGGYLDLETKAVFDTVDDIRDWRSYLAKTGTPNIHPGLVNEQGMEAALAEMAADKDTETKTQGGS